MKKFSKRVRTLLGGEQGRNTSRRDLLRGFGAISAMALFGTRASRGGEDRATTPITLARRSGPVPPPDRKLVGIQIGARSFVDEGVDGALDTLQEKGGVNTLFSTVFTYGRGLAGRQVPGQPLPDHGVQEYDEIHGGSYTAVHPEFYANSPISPSNLRAPELGDFDILADVTPKAKARGMKTYGLFEEVYNPRLIPNFQKITEVDAYGQISGSRRGREFTCLNNPGTRAFLLSMVADWMTSNELDGLMWESERQGPLNEMLGMHGGEVTNRLFAGCFCQYCVEKARDWGIDVERARRGYKALDKFIRRTLAGDRPTDGTGAKTFVSFWRLFVEYPEILAWHRFWFHSQEEMYGLIYGTAKAINPQAQVGWHLMYYVTLSPFFMADQDYKRQSYTADFLKPATYSNSGGPRFAGCIRNVQSTIFRDLTPEETLDLHYNWLQWENEAPLDKLPTAGFSPSYVGREAKRAIADVDGEIPIYPGIDVDVPTGLDQKRTQPEDVKADTLAAFEAGAQGIVLSRKYAEMKLTNLEGARAALEELGFY